MKERINADMKWALQMDWLTDMEWSSLFCVVSFVTLWRHWRECINQNSPSTLLFRVMDDCQTRTAIRSSAVSVDQQGYGSSLTEVESTRVVGHCSRIGILKCRNLFHLHTRAEIYWPIQGSHSTVRNCIILKSHSPSLLPRKPNWVWCYNFHHFITYFWVRPN